MVDTASGRSLSPLSGRPGILRAAPSSNSLRLLLLVRVASPLASYSGCRIPSPTHGPHVPPHRPRTVPPPPIPAAAPRRSKPCHVPRWRRRLRGPDVATAPPRHRPACMVRPVSHSAAPSHAPRHQDAVTCGARAVLCSPASLLSLCSLASLLSLSALSSLFSLAHAACSHMRPTRGCRRARLHTAYARTYRIRTAPAGPYRLLHTATHSLHRLPPLRIDRLCVRRYSRAASRHGPGTARAGLRRLAHRGPFTAAAGPWPSVTGARRRRYSGHLALRKPSKGPP